MLILPGQRPCELLPSVGIRCPSIILFVCFKTFHIFKIFSEST